MAIPFQLPRCDSEDDYQDLDRLLGDLFVVLGRILAQRGQSASESAAAISAGRGAVTIRRPSRQLRLQVTTDEDVDVLEVSSEDSSSDGDSSVPPSPTSPTAPIPDLVSGLPVQAEAPASQPAQHQALQTEEQAENQTPRASVAVRSRTRKPRSSPRKARSPRGGKNRRASAATSPAKELTRTPSTRAPKATPTVC